MHYLFWSYFNDLTVAIPINYSIWRVNRVWIGWNTAGSSRFGFRKWRFGSGQSGSRFKQEVSGRVKSGRVLKMKCGLGNGRAGFGKRSARSSLLLYCIYYCITGVILNYDIICVYNEYSTNYLVIKYVFYIINLPITGWLAETIVNCCLQIPFFPFVDQYENVFFYFNWIGLQ